MASIDPIMSSTFVFGKNCAWNFPTASFAPAKADPKFSYFFARSSVNEFT